MSRLEVFGVYSSRWGQGSFRPFDFINFDCFLSAISSPRPVGSWWWNLSLGKKQFDLNRFCCVAPVPGKAHSKLMTRDRLVISLPDFGLFKLVGFVGPFIIVNGPSFGGKSGDPVKKLSRCLGIVLGIDPATIL